jgi:hypothetical protein
MRNYSRAIVCCLLSLTVLCAGAAAQAPTKEYKINAVSLTFMPSTGDVYLDVTFTDNLDLTHTEDLKVANVVSIITKPSGTVLTPLPDSGGNVLTFLGNPRRLRIPIDRAGRLPADADTKVDVCFREIHFIDADMTPHAVAACGSGDLITGGNLKAKLALQLKKLEDTPQAKSSDEKNIFASGFTAKGEGDDAEGGAEIHLNSNDLSVPGLTAALHLRKATAEGADPKNFELELKQRTIWIFGASDLAKASAALDVNDTATAQRLTEEYRKRVFSSVHLDLGGKLEAEALGFDVTNFVGDGNVKILSRTKTLFGSKSGFYKFRLIPVGLEAGYNLGKADEAAAAAVDPNLALQLAEVDWITRFKAGAGFTLFYRNPESKLPFKRIEFDLQGVYRYLFNREVKFDETTKKNILTDRGHKPWFQGDLKFYMADTDRGRAGFKLTFNRGSLPPVFATTNSFQFGLIFETSEDEDKDKSAEP